MTTTRDHSLDAVTDVPPSPTDLPHDVAEIAPEHPRPGSLDSAVIQEALLGRWAAERRESRELAKDPALHRDPLLGMDEHRQRVFGQLGILVDSRAVHRAFPAEFGGDDNHGGNISAFGDLVVADPSLQIKAGVQWGLFSSAILHLGTADHHRRWLPGAMDLSIPGAFAMTEIGHGSDVASIATTATYDEATQEFVIHTPFKGAWKDYLGNAALHGKAATVFAQLITQGVNHGVHCFYVPIRDESGAFLPGVGGEDDGLKGGLNGIDNGRLHFTHVRVPRTNLLNRYGDVAEDGTYTSPIDSPGRRFFTMLGTLVQGRVSLSIAATTASFLGLHGAIAYGEQRRQFNASSPEREEVLLDYQNHQRRLIDRLARAYADAFSSNELAVKFDDVFSGRADTDVDRQELETLAAAVKPLTTWNALDTLQEAREACGGTGFMAKNRVTQLRADLDVYVTFEGDNTVLLQLVGKRLLTDYSKEFGRLEVGAVSRYVVLQASDALHRAGLPKVVQTVADAGSERRSANWFKDPAVQRELLEDRVRAKTADIAGTLSGARGKGQQAQAEAFNTRQHELVEAARNHAELLQWEAFTRAVDAIEDEATATVLTWLRDLFALRLIEDDLGWFVAHGRVSSQRARALRGYINRLAERLRPFALELVEAYGLEQKHLRMEVATDVEAERQEEAHRYFEQLRASGTAPEDEKVLRERQRKEAKSKASRLRRS